MASLKIRPVVVGTAGHIDHGKSSLVRSLTGIDPDRLKEERERGMTIDLGFARFELPGGGFIGIVDVPGHERFVRNMVAGATGIDIALLVVAADDGVMPQTREHLDIMKLLDVRHGLIALNKVDLVEPDLAELVAAEIRDTVQGTFLESARIIPVSAATGAGLNELRQALSDLAASIEVPPPQGLFRMPVQRVFSSPGFGTVLTGIPVSGEVNLGEILEVLPGGYRGKVRGIQAYHEVASSARAGHSTAINLTDVEHRSVSRGHVVCAPGFFSPVRMVAVRLSALPSLAEPIKSRIQVRMHTGTADPLGELVLLDTHELAPGGEALAQVRLSEPAVCAPGDLFILRLASPVMTLGGGVVIEESRHRLKRFKDFVIAELSRQESSLHSLRDLAETVLARAGERLCETTEVARAIKQAPERALELLEELERLGRVARAGSKQRWIHTEQLEAAFGRIVQRLGDWFERHPHRQVVPSLELRQELDMDVEVFSALVDVAVSRGVLAREEGGKLRPSNRRAELDPVQERLRAQVEELLRIQRFQPQAPAEIAQQMGASPADLNRVLELLSDEGRVRRIGGEIFLHASCMAEAEQAVRSNCELNGELDIPALRDALGTTRKWLIPLLEHFDAAGLTLRQGGRRILRRRAGAR